MGGVLRSTKTLLSFQVQRMFRFRSTFSSLLAAIALGLTAGGFSATGTTYAQRPNKSKKPKIEAPVDAVARTKDGLKMAMRYYPGPKSRQTIPIILIHGWKGQGSDFHRLADHLQRQGYSVLVPDLRGHGESTSVKIPGKQDAITLKAEKMRKNDLQLIVRFDLETTKSYLMKRHKQEELNVNALTIIGAEMGAMVAAYWTVQDWSWPQYPGVKQGQDVQAVVMLSPLQGFKGITIQPPFEQPALREKVSLFLVYGQNDSKASASVRRIRKSLKRYRQFDFDTDEEDRKERDVYVKGMDTTLQGTDLLTDQQLPTAKWIAMFIERRVKDRMEDEFPWSERTNPLN